MLLKRSILIMLMMIIGEIGSLTAFAASNLTGIPIYRQAEVPIVISATHPQFALMQPANPTTGYSWTKPAYNPELVKLISVYYQKPAGLQKVGASGKMVWIFRAQPMAFQQPSPTQIQLTYQRPWNPKDNPKVVIFKIKFSSAG